MEGDPLFPDGGLEYLFGAHVVGQAFLPFWAHDRAGEKRAFEEFMDWLAAQFARHPDAHVYHYNHYEPTALKRLAMRHGTREAMLDDMLRRQRFVDLYVVVREQLRISEPRYSLKNVEKFFRAGRDGEVENAADSIVAYERFCDTGEVSILSEIEAYNKIDCISTGELRNWLLGLRSADAAFLQRYCAPNRPGITGTAARLKGVPIEVARCVISKLTDLVPNADHSTPGWDWNGHLLPAVVIGHLGADLSIRSPRCGLWADVDKLYFWADKRVFAARRIPTQGWVDYGHPNRAGSPSPMLRYPEPLKCICGGGDDVVLPGPVVEFLLAFKAIAVASEWRDGPLAPWDVYDTLDTGETPPSDKDDDARDEVPDCQDRDVSHHADRPSESEDPNEVGSTKSSAVESPKIGQKNRSDCDVTWLGIVYLDENNSAIPREMPLETAQAAWPDRLPQPQKIIFMGIGPKSGISIIADEIRSLFASTLGNIPAIAPPTAAHYIYAYHEQPDWDGVFYVGKGKKRRYLSHLNEAFQIIRVINNRPVAKVGQARPIRSTPGQITA